MEITLRGVGAATHAMAVLHGKGRHPPGRRVSLACWEELWQQPLIFTYLCSGCSSLSSPTPRPPDPPFPSCPLAPVCPFSGPRKPSPPRAPFAGHHPYPTPTASPSPPNFTHLPLAYTCPPPTAAPLVLPACFLSFSNALTELSHRFSDVLQHACKVNYDGKRDITYRYRHRYRCKYVQTCTV